MLVKIMSGEDAPDDDTRKVFKILGDVTAAEFSRAKGKPEVEVAFRNGTVETFPCPGNVYLMNDNGDTVASFGSAPYRKAA